MYKPFFYIFPVQTNSINREEGYPEKELGRGCALRRPHTYSDADGVLVVHAARYKPSSIYSPRGLFLNLEEVRIEKT